MKRKKKLIILVVSILILGAVTTFLLQDSYYSKQSRAEVIWRTFMYSAENNVSLVLSPFTKEKSFVLDVPFHKQAHPVTCEVASLRMVLDYYGLPMSEDDLLTHLHFDTTDPITPDRIWGDPEKGFVGDVDGSIFEGTGYGVHDGPIRQLAKLFLNSVEIKDPDVMKIVGLVSGGKPVIVWGLLSSRKTVSWRTEEGREVEVYPGEHARVVVGFTGEAHDPKKLILLDPIYGKIRMSVKEFAEDWEIMDSRAVVVL